MSSKFEDVIESILKSKGIHYIRNMDVKRLRFYPSGGHGPYFTPDFITSLGYMQKAVLLEPHGVFESDSESFIRKLLYYKTSALSDMYHLIVITQTKPDYFDRELSKFGKKWEEICDSVWFEPSIGRRERFKPIKKPTFYLRQNFLDTRTGKLIPVSYAANDKTAGFQGGVRLARLMQDDWLAEKIDDLKKGHPMLTESGLNAYVSLNREELGRDRPKRQEQKGASKEAEGLPNK